jgi:hypothetical protein
MVQKSPQIGANPISIEQWKINFKIVIKINIQEQKHLRRNSCSSSRAVPISEKQG